VTRGCGAELIAARQDGRPVAVAVCEHSQGMPGSMDMTWSAARTFRLTTLVADADVTRGLDILLSRWRDRLNWVHGAYGPDTSAAVTWPSRDVAGVAALLRHRPGGSGASVGLRSATFRDRGAVSKQFH
jgi:hypothetical protein